jgi:hypothetical protein
VFSFEEDLDLKSDVLSLFPIYDNSFILPPFVFYLTFDDTNMQPIFLDSRDYGSNDSRFIRSCCRASDKSNAQLITVICITSAEAQDRARFNDLNIPIVVTTRSNRIPLNQRLRLCIFATRPIPAGEEVILNSTSRFLNFPCACDQPKCRISQAISKIEHRHDIEGGIFF